MFSFAKKLVDRFEGSEAKDSYFKNTLQINNRGYALRVLAVTPHSAAQAAGLEAWFDYIVGVNNHELPMAYPSVGSYSYSINEDGTINYGGSTTADVAGMVDFNLLSQEISSITSHGGELVLDVWNAKGGIIRKVSIPLENGEAPLNTDIRPLVLNIKQIGLTLQSQHVNTATYVWRILATHQDLPAFQAQLIPYSDYIIGCDSAFPDDPYGKGLLSQGGESLLSNTVLRYFNHNSQRDTTDFVPITLYVYNHDYDVLRPVTVNLTRNWGNGHNKGILGCDVGYGLLHRIPEVVGKFDTEKLVDDVLFENQQNFDYQLSEPSGQQFTPMAQAIPPPASKPAKKKKHSRPDALNGLNEYMNEELEKSKEREIHNKPPPSSGSVPPPPKIK